MKTKPTTLYNASRTHFTTKPVSGRKLVLVLLMHLLCAAALVLPVFGAQAAVVLTTLYSFTGINDGAHPHAGLVQGSDGYFYGTTQWGGTTNEYGYDETGYGTVFKISTKGALTTLYSFTGGDDGTIPRAGLVEGSDGNFYGTTLGGWDYMGPGFGSVFKISPNGALTTLYAFGEATNEYGVAVDGNGPSGLAQGSDDCFYGTTRWGGTWSTGGYSSYGNVFKISTNGALTTLYSFTGGDDGGFPNELVQGSDGNFYGTTMGTVFKISANGALTTLCSGGGNGLVQGIDGNFYGTTEATINVSFPWMSVNGSVFKVTTNGAWTTLHSFLGGDDGLNPVATLVQGSDGNFYGTTADNGMWFGFDIARFTGSGTVFRISPNGTLTTLYAFGSITSANGEALDGANPCAALVQGSDGSFYGTTQWGGTNGAGTVFRLTIVPDPQLTIILSGPYTILTWPTNYAGFDYTGYTLQSTTNLGSSAIWTTNSPAPVVVNGLNTVTNPISGTQQFFRLRK